MSQTVRSAHEMYSQSSKVLLVSDLLIADGVTSEQADAMPNTMRREVHEMAGYTGVPLPATWDEIVFRLERNEVHLSHDWAGRPQVFNFQPPCYPEAVEGCNEACHWHRMIYFHAVTCPNSPSNRMHLDTPDVDD